MAGKGAYNPFEMARAQFDKIADLIELDQGAREFLRTPMREFHFTIPVLPEGSEGAGPPGENVGPDAPEEEGRDAAPGEERDEP